MLTFCFDGIPAQLNNLLQQMMMRDNNGMVYCRREMGKEVYFQQFQQQKTHYEFVHRIEKTVRKAIQDEQGSIVL